MLSVLQISATPALVHESRPSTTASNGLADYTANPCKAGLPSDDIQFNGLQVVITSTR
jgi:hypothetical protein